MKREERENNSANKFNSRKVGEWGLRGKKGLYEWNQEQGGEHNLGWAMRRNWGLVLQGLKAKVNEFYLYPKSNGII